MPAPAAAARILFLICAAGTTLAYAPGEQPQPEAISDGLEAFNWREPAVGASVDCYQSEPSAGAEAGQVHFVVLDAGSTGTRAVAHAFRRNVSSHLGFDHLGFVRNESRPGLSAFGRYPRRCRAQLEALIAKVADAVPKAQRARTCLLLRATAGFRLMDARARYLVAREVRAALLASEFRSLGLESVRMLDGAEEAKFTWLTVNYLLGNFRDSVQATKPVIEMGGGSLQIAYESPDGDQTLAPLSGRDGGPGRGLRLQARSYLGLGIRESILRFVGHDGGSGPDGNLTSYQTACLADNLTLDFTFGSVKVQLVGRVAGPAPSPGDREARSLNTDCMTRALNLTARIGVREELALSDSTHGRHNWPVYAISGVFHLLEFLHRQQASVPGVRVNFSASACPGREPCKAYATTVGEVTLAAYAVCRDIPRDGLFKPLYCINLAVTAALLQSGGMGLPDATPLVALGGQKALGWTLGLSLEYLRASAGTKGAAGVGPESAWCCGALVAALLATRL